MTLLAIASFGLAIAGVSSLGENDQNTSEKESFTQSVLKQHAAIPSSLSYSDTSTATADRRAPEMARVQLSGKIKSPVHRTLTRNKFTIPQAELSKIVRENHMAAINERAQEAMDKAQKGNEQALPSEKKSADTALASANQKNSKTITEAAGGKKTKSDEETSLDYRRKLLRKAVTEVLSSEEPWKELIAIALVQADIKDFTGAKETLMLAKRLIPDSDSTNVRANALVSITQGFCRINQTELALDTAVYISETKAQNQALSSIITSHLQSKEFSAAKTLVSSLSLIDYREASLRNIAEAEAYDGKHSPAMSTASLISSMSMRNDALHRIAVTQAKAKQWDTALSTAGLISDTDVSQNTMAEIIRIRIDAGETGMIHSYIANIRREATRDDLYGRLARKQASLGNIIGGQRSAELIINDINKENTLAAIAVQQARYGNTLEAFNKASSLINHGPQSQGVRDVTLVEANMRGTPSAYNMASMIENSTARDSTLRAMAQREAGLGNLKEAVNCAHSINAEECRVLSLAETALSCIRQSPSRQAVTVLENTTPLATGLSENNSSRNEALIKIANAYALINRVSESIGYINQLPSKAQQNNALQQISYDCADRNNLAHAQDLAARISDDSLRKTTSAGIAKRHARHVLPENSSSEVEKFQTKEERAAFLRAMAAKAE